MNHNEYTTARITLDGLRAARRIIKGSAPRRALFATIKALKAEIRAHEATLPYSVALEVNGGINVLGRYGVRVEAQNHADRVGGRVDFDPTREPAAPGLDVPASAVPAWKDWIKKTQG
jgi:hypothetical protein